MEVKQSNTKRFPEENKATQNCIFKNKRGEKSNKVIAGVLLRS